MKQLVTCVSSTGILLIILLIKYSNACLAISQAFLYSILFLPANLIMNPARQDVGLYLNSLPFSPYSTLRKYKFLLAYLPDKFEFYRY